VRQIGHEIELYGDAWSTEHKIYGLYLGNCKIGISVQNLTRFARYLLYILYDWPEDDLLRSKYVAKLRYNTE